MTHAPEHHADADARRTCYACFRPEAYCYCSLLPRINNRTGIIILQHPRERFHPIGTARIVERSLERVRVEIDHERRFARDSGALQLPPNTGLLFPGRDSTQLAGLAPEQRPEHLVVLDGTWHHASTLYRDVRALHRLPRFAFVPEEPSRYRLRREPQRDYVSTVEAVAQCLRLLEPETRDVDRMLAVFHTMIDRQHAAQTQNFQGGRPRRARAKESRALPRALVEDYERLVVVYGESVPAATPPGSELVQWVAHRLSTGETFSTLLRPSVVPSAQHLAHLKLSASELAEAPGADAFPAEWQRFIRGDDILATWNPTALKLLLRNTSWAGRRIFLKAAYLNLRRHRGSLDEILRQEGVRADALAVPGRAGERLSNAVAIADFLHRAAG